MSDHCHYHCGLFLSERVRSGAKDSKALKRVKKRFGGKFLPRRYELDSIVVRDTSKC